MQRHDDCVPTCSECGCDCEPEIFDGGEGVGIRVAFSCPEHGLHGVTDPFEALHERGCIGLSASLAG